MGKIRRFFLYLGFAMIGVGLGFIFYGAFQEPVIVEPIIIGMALVGIGGFLAFAR